MGVRKMGLMRKKSEEGCLSEKTQGYRKGGIKVNGGRTNMGKWKEVKKVLIVCKQALTKPCA